MRPEDKLLSGYYYRNTPMKQIDESRNINIWTGIGGAKMMIDAYRKEGLSDEYIETLIEVSTDGHGWQPLSAVSVKDIT